MGDRVALQSEHLRPWEMSMGPHEGGIRDNNVELLEKYRQRLHSFSRCFDVCMQINSTLELEELLDNIMTTSREVMKADACSLMLVDEETQELVFKVAQGIVGPQLQREFRLQKGEGIAGHVFETGEPLIVEDAYTDSRFCRTFDTKTGYRTQSMLCVPLKVKDRIIGVSQVINKLDGTPFTEEDKETFGLLSAQAALAIDNARVHRALLRKQQLESDLAFASTVQQSFLPQSLPVVQGFRFQAHNQAALQVGGDFYDFIPLQGRRLGILVGDVSGKGVSSALYMARLTSDFRLQATHQKGAARVVEQVNDLLCERSRGGMFVTLIYVVLNAPMQTITYVNAGHLPPLLWNGSQRRFRAFQKGGGPPLGILKGRQYSSGRFSLAPGDCVLLATDGLIEARNPDGLQFGWARLEKAIRDGDSRLEGVYKRIMGSLGSFVRGSSQSDDITMVLLSVEKAGCC